MLEVRDIHKSYEGQPLLMGISFTLEPRQTICLLGPSGSGKSTLLRIIAGLETAERGQVLWQGRDLAGTPPHLRDFGLVFQDYALFPHMDVADNVSFGLKMKGWPDDDRTSRLAEVLELVNLSGFEHRDVTALSGGEQQRVALARALAPRPRLLMFDEPLGALDRALREELIGQLRLILHRTGIPSIYVTHDQEEAFGIAHRILLLHEGRIVRAGEPHHVWARPGSTWAAGFLGLGNILPATVLDTRARMKTRCGIFVVHCAHQHHVGDEINLLVRPKAVAQGTLFKGIVRDRVFEQDEFKITLSNGLYFYLAQAPHVGKGITIRVRMECLGRRSDSEAPGS